MDNIDPSLFTGGGVLACLAALFTALWRGWLWTGPQVSKLEAGYQGRIESLREGYESQLDAERERTDEWRGIALKSIANADKVGPQLEALLAGQATQQAVLAALRERAGQP